MKFTVGKRQLVKEYSEADRLLTSRIQDKRTGYDTMDKLYNTYLDPAKWPYSVKLATPRGFTAVYNKTTRMIGGRFTGRVEGQEMGDDLGAKIATEHFKWSVNRFNQHSTKSIEEYLSLFDTNARLYGGGFMRVYWKTEYKRRYNPKTKKYEPKKVYDGWWIETLNNRDVMLQPGRETIGQSDYVIIRRYASLEQLEKIVEDGVEFNEKAMDELRDAKTGMGRETNYESPIKIMKGLDYEDDRFEICTTYYRDKWVTWCPKQGTTGRRSALILREIENPYIHQEIPIVPLTYIPSQEDIIGMSELQPVAALLKILSAIQSQFIEYVNQRVLYPPTLADATETRIDTFKYRPKAIWLVNNPDKVKEMQSGTSPLANFSETYKMIVTEFLEAMGETGQGISQADLLGGDKTATEVKDRAFLRGSRDNFNKLLLTTALRRVMYLVFEMLRDPKFTDKNTVVKVVGKEALEYFDKQGLAQWGLNDEGYDLVAETTQELMKDNNFKNALGDRDPFQETYDILLGAGVLDQFGEPAQPVVTAKEVVSKLIPGDDDNTGYLYVDPEEDYIGEYNFIPDVEALGMPDVTSEYQSRAQWYAMVKESEKDGTLAREGYTFKHKELLSKLGELAKVKEAEQYFAQEDDYEALQAGAGQQGAGPGGQAVPPEQAVQSSPGNANQQAGQQVPVAG